MKRRLVARNRFNFTTRNWDVVCETRKYLTRNNITPVMNITFFGYQFFINCSNEQADEIDRIIKSFPRIPVTF